MNPDGMSLPLSAGLVLKAEPREIASPMRDLTEAICAGDERAFSRFYDLYSVRLYKQVLVLSKGNETEAREVLQAVVLKLANRFQVFDEEQRLWAWLSRCLLNGWLDFCRSRKREERVLSLDQLEAELPQMPQAEHLWAEALRLALNQFAPDEQELLRSAYVDDRPLQELAEERCQTYKAVESRLGRLRKKLKTRLLSYVRDERSR
jgi:RNA polymerase sigma-70 factor (ECF subfamily)